MMHLLFLLLTVTAHAGADSSPTPSSIRIGAGYDLLALPNEIQELKKQMHELQEKNKILEARLDSLEKNKVP